MSVYRQVLIVYILFIECLPGEADRLAERAVKIQWKIKSNDEVEE